MGVQIVSSDQAFYRYFEIQACFGARCAVTQPEVETVSQVAYEVGFSNLSYFSGVFKEELGELPSEYERKIT